MPSAFRCCAGAGTGLAPGLCLNRDSSAGDRAGGMAFALAQSRAEFKAKPTRVESAPEAVEMRTVIMCAAKACRGPVSTLELVGPAITHMPECTALALSCTIAKRSAAPHAKPSERPAAYSLSPARSPSSSQAPNPGSGDGNRAPHYQLGNWTEIMRADAADQPTGLTLSVCDWPHAILANCTAPHVARDGSRPVRAGSGLAFDF